MAGTPAATMTITTEQPSEAPGPPDPPPFGAKRGLRILMVFLGVQILVAVVIGVWAAMHNLRKGGPASPDGIKIDPLVTLGAAFGGTLLAGLAVLRSVRRAFALPGGDAVRAAVGWRTAPRRDCFRAAFAGLGLVVAFVVMGAMLPVRPTDLGPLARAASAGGGARFFWAALAIGVAPPVEELVFRGALYAGLARSWGPSWAALATTAIFVALHATEVGAYWPAWMAIATLGALALRARLVTGSLLPAIALHATYNLGLVLMVYAQAGRA
jgi:membrane protease YdiL (CAAX protease family)